MINISVDIKIGSASNTSIIADPGASGLPGAPTSLVATADTDQLASDTSIDLTWVAPADDGGASITGYRIERNDGSGFTDLVANTGNTNTNYTDGSLDPNTSYTYRIRAINSNGGGATTSVSETTTKLFVPIPTSPTFADPVAITTTPTGKNIDNTALASKTDVTFSEGQTANISTTYTVGTKTTPVRFKSLSPTNRTILGDGTVLNNPCFRGSTAGSSRHVELYDFIFYENQAGVSWPGNVDDTNPSTIYIQNIESHRHGFASYWVNTANGYYDRISSKFLRYFELDEGSTSAVDGGEGLYIGHTTQATRSKINESHHFHLYGNAAAREGVQLTAINDMVVANATIRNSGTWGASGSGQNRIVQSHSTIGIYRDCIFDGSPSAWEVQATNNTFYNCYFKWMNTDKPFIGGFSNGLGAGEPQFDGEPIIFDSCIFKTNVTGGLLQVQTLACDVIVRNCIISDTASSLFHDTRSGGSNSLIDGGGNTFVNNSLIPDPTYEIEPEFDLHLTYADTAAMIADQASQTAGRRYLAGSIYYTRKPTSAGDITDYIITEPAYVVTNDYFYNRRMGYRTLPHKLQPTDIELSQTLIEEGQGINYVIATISTVGGSGDYTYTVLDHGFRSDDADAFNISGSSLRASIVFDAGTQDEYYVRVRAASTEDPMRYVDKVFLLSVVAEATVATDITLSSLTVDENVSVDTVVATISDNASPGGIWTLVSGTGSTDNASFSISGNQLIIETSPDFETKSSYAIRIRSTNSANASLTYEEAFTITVNDLEEGVTSEYTAILDAATTSSYTLPTAGQQTKQNQVILDLKNAGVWSKLDAFWVFCTDGSSTFSYINWKNPATYRITLTGSPVFTTNSGWRSNGNTHYLNSNFTFSTDAVNYTQNDSSWTLGMTAPTNGTGTYVFGAFSGTDIGVGFRRFNSNVVYTYMNGALSTSAATFQNGDFAVFTANRVNSIGYTVYRNGASILTPVVTSDVLPSVNMPIGAIRNSGGTIAGSVSSGSIKFLALGASLTTDEIATLNTTMTTYCNNPS